VKFVDGFVKTVVEIYFSDVRVRIVPITNQIAYLLGQKPPVRY